MEIVMQMRYMNGFLRELSENILNHIKILGFSRSEVGGFGSTAEAHLYRLMCVTSDRSSASGVD